MLHSDTYIYLRMHIFILLCIYIHKNVKCATYYSQKKKNFGLSAQFINNWKSYINNKNRK